RLELMAALVGIRHRDDATDVAKEVWRETHPVTPAWARWPMRVWSVIGLAAVGVLLLTMLGSAEARAFFNLAVVAVVLVVLVNRVALGGKLRTARQRLRCWEHASDLIDAYLDAAACAARVLPETTSLG